MKKLAMTFLVVFCLIVVTFGSALAEDAFKTIYISQGSLDDHECDNTQWHIVINQLNDEEGQMPGSIEVTWANGVTETVALSNVTGGVAHYYTTLNLNYKVTGAEAEIYAGWDGEFVLSHGPCNPTAVELVSFEAVNQHPVLWGIVIFVLLLVAVFVCLALWFSGKKK